MLKRLATPLPLQIMDGPAPLFERICRALRSCILNGQLQADTPLPSSRALALQLGVARSTVVAAYEQLLAEGYVCGRGGAGTYVSADLPHLASVSPGQPLAPDPGAVQLSRHAVQALRIAPRVGLLEQQPFAIGCTDMDAPLRTRFAKALEDALAAPLGYGNPQGCIKLRTALARYLGASRGVLCQPEQILITAGAQGAVELALRVLLDPGARVWLEDPAYALNHVLLENAGLQACPVPVDAQGLDVAHGRAFWPDAAAALVTPSHQYPLGVSMSLGRRLELLAWARDQGAWIIEDDYDSEFRYAGAPIAALQGLDRAGRVLYVGTFSKSLFAALRLGYLVLPSALVPASLASLCLSHRAPAALIQSAVAGFIEDGSFASHLRRARGRYAAARSLLLAALHRQLPGGFEVLSPAQGMHLAIRLQQGCDQQIAERLSQARVMARPLSPLYRASAGIQGLALGFTGFAEAELLEAVGVLARVVRTVA